MADHDLIALFYGHEVLDLWPDLDFARLAGWSPEGDEAIS